MTQIQIISEEIKRELADPGTIRTLLATVFPGFDEKLMRQALFEIMMRGIPFTDILKKRVYAIKYGDKYSIVFSIDHARVLAQKGGIIGNARAEYQFDEKGNVIACTCTVKKKVDGDIGEFSATAFMDEFNTGRNQWAKMPKHMIAKVAEMHALRKAFPDVLDKAYSEEEMEQATVIEGTTPETEEKISFLTNINNLNALKNYYSEHKGLGKAFDKAVSARKKELEAALSQGPDSAESRMVPDEEA